MTDEELEQALQELQESLDKLPDSDSLTKPERRRRYVLLLKKETLLRIKEAREKNNKHDEFTNIANYGVLTAYGDKHPILMRLARAKFGINL